MQTMEPVWNGLLTSDYEHSRPDASPLYWELATRSHITWPQVLMDEPTPYGVLRRPGIVDIDERDHIQIVTAWHALLTSPDLVDELVSRTAADRAAAADAIATLEQASERADLAACVDALRPATAAVLRVSCTQIVNWLLPEPHWERLLTDLLGTPQKARTCLLAMQLPDQPGMILASAATSTERDRVQAASRRDAWRLAAELSAGLRAGKDSPLMREVTAMATVLRWAATCEERRHELRARYLRQVAAWCAAIGADEQAITIDDLLRAAA